MENNSLPHLTKEIPVIFKEDKKGIMFPNDYVNDVAYWGNNSKSELHSCFNDGTAKMLSMDLDFGDACSLKCQHCFRRDSRFDKITLENALTPENVYDYIKQAKKLGLKTIKILGRGEPFQNTLFLKFLRDMTKLDIGVSVFTKGHVIGSDRLASIYNKDYGIETSEQLVKELKKLKVSILLGFNSFDKKMQESFVGIDKSPIKNYVELRNNALVLLAKAGFNEYKKWEPTRLAMISAPIKPENIGEVFKEFVWARKRNIYMLSCPTNLSGKGIDEFKRAVSTYNATKSSKTQYEEYIKDLERLYSKIYIWSIKKGLVKKDAFEEDGVSLYPGCHPCNQTASGIYLTLSGEVLQCPGRATGNAIISNNVKEHKNLKDVWINSINYKRAKSSKAFNFYCVARDGYSLPGDFYSTIKEMVLSKTTDEHIRK